MGVMEPGPDAALALTEARADVDAPSIGPGILGGRLVIGSLDDPMWQRLPAESANPVKVARQYAGEHPR
jgi:hypothetical protein